MDLRTEPTLEEQLANYHELLLRRGVDCTMQKDEIGITIRHTNGQPLDDIE